MPKPLVLSIRRSFLASITQRTHTASEKAVWTLLRSMEWNQNGAACRRNKKEKKEKETSWQEGKIVSRERRQSHWFSNYSETRKFSYFITEKRKAPHPPFSSTSEIMALNFETRRWARAVTVVAGSVRRSSTAQIEIHSLQSKSSSICAPSFHRHTNSSRLEQCT